MKNCASVYAAAEHKRPRVRAGYEGRLGGWFLFQKSGVRRGNPVAIDDRLPDPFRPETNALDAAILQRRVGKAGVRCGRALGHVPLEAVAEKNADLPAAVNRARFVLKAFKNSPRTRSCCRCVSCIGILNER